MEHKWDDYGERCLQCGDKDWFAGSECKPPIVSVRACREADRAMAATPAGQELLACAINDLLNESATTWLPLPAPPKYGVSGTGKHSEE